MAQNPVEERADELVKLAIVLGPEDEGLDLSDLTLELEDLVALRSLLSSRRRAIDIVNAALANYWTDNFGNETFVTEHTIWSVGRRKGKKLVDADRFFDWLSQQTPDKLKSIVSPSSIKVGGFTPEERTTFLDERPVNDKLSINDRPRT